MTTALVSALTGIPVKSNVAMTGEITLRGRVLPIGGLREKLLAAVRAGIERVVLPKANRENLYDVPEEIKGALKIEYVENRRRGTEVCFDHASARNGIDDQPTWNGYDT